MLGPELRRLAPPRSMSRLRSGTGARRLRGHARGLFFSSSARFIDGLGASVESMGLGFMVVAGLGAFGRCHRGVVGGLSVRDGGGAEKSPMAAEGWTSRLSSTNMTAQGKGQGSWLQSWLR